MSAKNRIKSAPRGAFLGVVVLFFLLLILILGQALNFLKILSSPWNNEGRQITKNYSYKKEFNLNLLIRSGNISLLSFNPTDESLTFLSLPDKLYINTPYGFGKWQLGSIYELGQSSKIGGEMLLNRSISDYLGLPVDGFISFDRSFDDKSSKEILDYLTKAPLNIFGIFSKLKTNLSLWELINLKFSLSNIRFDKITTIDLEKRKLLLEENLPDGTSVFVSETGRLDGISDKFIDPKIRSEGMTIALYNATEHPLIAQNAARLIENIGGNVIIVSNADKTSDKTYVLGEKSNTVKRMIQIFDSVCVNIDCGKISPSDLGLFSSRAQVNIILGEDYYQKFIAPVK